ncbi:hypothetical protein TNIN_73241 [Trichonephila inaurata madagascariensis]|uniref:Uncharacterized protein n=1 Tax=Trichonephila inaurata madagascariensis TaxID=2747483 RepID=A0A8X6YTY3_9ARAC|nr:hypothetical protein TNIN_73241 [Trichonephila inaurata madagascariensis]
MIQNSKLNIVECIEGLDNRKKYLVSQRSDDNFKISIDSVTTLVTDLAIDPEFPISKLRKKVYLFVYEGSEREMNQLQKFLPAIGDLFSKWMIYLIILFDILLSE